VAVAVGMGVAVAVAVGTGVAVAVAVGSVVAVAVGIPSRVACKRVWTVASISGVGVDVGVGWAVRMAASMVACRSVVGRDSPPHATTKTRVARAKTTQKTLIPYP